ncbi:protein of unknown function [Magnetospira sp. QH-2]|nr:protein of unknown function [Magnetospira sp. QH-2]
MSSIAIPYPLDHVVFDRIRSNTKIVIDPNRDARVQRVRLDPTRARRGGFMRVGRIILWVLAEINRACSIP